MYSLSLFNYVKMQKQIMKKILCGLILFTPNNQLSVGVDRPYVDEVCPIVHNSRLRLKKWVNITEITHYSRLVSGRLMRGLLTTLTMPTIRLVKVSCSTVFWWVSKSLCLEQRWEDLSVRETDGPSVRSSLRWSLTLMGGATRVVFTPCSKKTTGTVTFADN